MISFIASSGVSLRLDPPIKSGNGYVRVGFSVSKDWLIPSGGGGVVNDDDSSFCGSCCSLCC